VFRCYRYGQTKSVFVYRLFTEGTMEEKIYSIAANKTTLASSVNDGKDLLRLFTAEEMSNINAAPVSWVQCDQVRTYICMIVL
jgi:transcriptional regulator ATRX